MATSNATFIAIFLILNSYATNYIMATLPESNKKYKTIYEIIFFF